jgi:methionyl-tRNA formyltransferase
VGKNDIVFMGTPDFAAVSLQALYDAGFSVTAVFTQPDRPKNRGHRLQACPVKILAEAHGTPVLQPGSFSDGEAAAELARLAPSVIAVVAYGKLLPPEVLKIPALGCINIHGSLLPRYRGAAPIQWTVLNGDPTAGVSAMFMSERLDAGDVIDSISTDVLPGETAGELFDRLAPLGGELLVRTVGNLLDGTASRTPQDEEQATYAPPLTKAMSPVDWNQPVEQILCRIRGLHPWPCATAEWNGVCYKIHKAEAAGSAGTAEPGTVLQADGDGMTVAAGDGAVSILEIQAPGGKRMRAADYFRGHTI